MIHYFSALLDSFFSSFTHKNSQMKPWQFALVVIAIVLVTLLIITIWYFLFKKKVVSNTPALAEMGEIDHEKNEVHIHKETPVHNTLSKQKAIYDNSESSVQTPLSPPSQQHQKERKQTNMDVVASEPTHHPMESINKRIFSLSPTPLEEDGNNSTRDSTVQSIHTYSSYRTTPVSCNTPPYQISPQTYRGPTPPFTQHPGRKKH
ncbi:hypothetical protein BDB01DRAFT_790264 [Pilobolus umbonatus]|nr:hypothetical protein BDB01DRAFT_790264 [Pilobolus umbonatus]